MFSFMHNYMVEILPGGTSSFSFFRRFLYHSMVTMSKRIMMQMITPTTQPTIMPVLPDDDELPPAPLTVAT